MIIREIVTKEEFKQFADFIVYGYYPSPDENGVLERTQRLVDINKVQDLYLIALYESLLFKITPKLVIQGNFVQILS